jgi:hypothetical protein
LDELLRAADAYRGTFPEMSDPRQPPSPNGVARGGVPPPIPNVTHVTNVTYVTPSASDDEAEEGEL